MKNSITFILIQFAIILMWLIGWYLIERNVPSTSAGIFGDQFGVLTSIFSAMAFGGIIYSIIIQTRELSLTRKEFSKSSESQALSSKALVAQLEIQQNVALISAVTMLIEQYEKNKFLQTLEFGSAGEYELELKSYVEQLNYIIKKLQEHQKIH